MRYEDSFDEVEWREDERAALDALPRERAGSARLRERTTAALRNDGTLRPARRLLRAIIPLSLAASLFFVAGGIVGYAIARRSVVSPADDAPSTNRVALDTNVQAPATDSVRHVVWF